MKKKGTGIRDQGTGRKVGRPNPANAIIKVLKERSQEVGDLILSVSILGSGMKITPEMERLAKDLMNEIKEGGAK